MSEREGDGLTETQVLALAELARGRTQREAADAVGVSDRTIRNWMGLPAFQAALREARATLLAETSTLLHSAAGAAVRTLREVMEDSRTGGLARVLAARAALTLTYRSAEVDDLTQRMTELEAALAEVNGASVPGGAGEAARSSSR